MRKIGVILALILGLGVISASLDEVKASEGEFNLSSVIGDSARCSAFSVYLQDNYYHVLISCRDILYPGGTEVNTYMIWTNPLDGGNPEKLGPIGLGKQNYKIRNAFTSMFVTKETSSNVRKPEGPVIMRGGLQRFEFLDNPELVMQEQGELGQPEISPTPEAQAGGSRLNIFRIGGLLAFILLFVVIVVVLIITRR